MVKYTVPIFTPFHSGEFSSFPLYPHNFIPILHKNFPIPSPSQQCSPSYNIGKMKLYGLPTIQYSKTAGMTKATIEWVFMHLLAVVVELDCSVHCWVHCFMLLLLKDCQQLLLSSSSSPRYYRHCFILPTVYHKAVTITMVNTAVSTVSQTERDRGNHG